MDDDYRIIFFHWNTADAAGRGEHIFAPFPCRLNVINSILCMYVRDVEKTFVRIWRVLS